MNLHKGERRKLTADLAVRTSYSIGYVPEGEIIEIQQVDQGNRKALVHSCWVHGPTLERISEPLESSPC